MTRPDSLEPEFIADAPDCSCDPPDCSWDPPEFIADDDWPELFESPESELAYLLGEDDDNGWLEKYEDE